MRKDISTSEKYMENKNFLRFLDGRIKDYLLLAVLGLSLTFIVWRVFNMPSNATQETTSMMSNTEMKIGRLLSEIEGVGEAEVIVSEDEEGVNGAIVVCGGANNLRVVMDIREAVAAALNIEQSNIKIYLKKE